MATNAVIGSKTTVSYYDLAVSPADYTKYAEVRSFGEVGLKRPEVDVTHLDSDAVERIGGLQDGESINIMMNMTSSNFGVVKDQVDAGTTLTLKVDFTATGFTETLYFDFVPLEYKVGKVDPKNELQLTLTGRITGDIVETDPN